MVAKSFKILSLLGLVLLVGGAYPDICFNGCLGNPPARWVEYTFADPTPPDGYISQGTVTITISGTEEATVAAGYVESAWIKKWNEALQKWESLTPDIPETWNRGTWVEETGMCSKTRDTEFSFVDVPLTAGTNAFQITLMVDGWDGMEDQWFYWEVTYTH